MTHQAIEAFIEMIKAERGAGVLTAKAYSRDLNDFRNFLLKLYKGAALEKASTDQVRHFIRELSNRHFSSKTIARKVSALKQFYQFMVTEKNIKTNPVIEIDVPKITRSLPRYLDQKEIEVLIKEASKDDSPQGQRFLVMLELTYGSGLRVSELVGLNMESLQVGSKKGEIKNFLIIRGKGNKERLVPINDNARKLLEKYLNARELWLKGNHSPWVFPSKPSRGAKAKSGHISRVRFGQLLKELAINANIDPQKVSPHVLRHSFASHMLAGGADLRIVQELLGHTDISTTQIYTHIEQERLVKLVTKHHPLAKGY